MKYHNQASWILSIILLLSMSGCRGDDNQTGQQNGVLGQNLIYLPLEGEIANRYAEISGLTWHIDQLIILPQYPDRFSTGAIYRIPKQQIIDYLNQPTPSSKISPIKIEFDDNEIPGRIPGFQGFESIVFVGKRVYLTIEINQRGSMAALLVEGSINKNMDKIILDKTSIDSLPMPLQIRNYSYESIVDAGDKLLLFYEANGSNLTNTPQMVQLNLENGQISLEPFLNLEYRITDATSLDMDGRFWVVNYFWPGDYEILQPGPDQLSAFVIPAPIYSSDTALERLVEMKYSSAGIDFSGKAPIVLGTKSKEDSRNWEGIVRLDNLGFILATDKHPRTILAFVPFE